MHHHSSLIRPTLTCSLHELNQLSQHKIDSEQLTKQLLQAIDPADIEQYKEDIVKAAPGQTPCFPEDEIIINILDCERASAFVLSLSKQINRIPSSINRVVRLTALENVKEALNATRDDISINRYNSLLTLLSEHINRLKKSIPAAAPHRGPLLFSSIKLPTLPRVGHQHGKAQVPRLPRIGH